jgi:hypothetical protein
VAVDFSGRVLTSTNPTGGASAWKIVKPDDPLDLNRIDGKSSLTDVSCPTTTFCVAVNDSGNVVISTNPTGGSHAWRTGPADVRNNAPLMAVSCPSTNLCVAVDDSGKVVVGNRNGLGFSWRSGDITVGDGGLYSIDCPSEGYCIVGGTTGQVYWSLTPSSLHDESWGSQGPLGGGYVTGASCPAASLCVLLDTEGNAITVDPTGNVIHKKEVAGFDELLTISCPSSGLCVAGDLSGNVVTSTTPAAGASTWAVKPVSSSAILDVSCPTASLCVGSANGSKLLTSTNPTGGAAAWQVEPAPGGARPDSVSCPSANLCVAYDGNGKVLTSTNPAGGAATWQVTTGVGTSWDPGEVTCPSPTLCLIALSSSSVLTSTDPTGGASAWQRTQLASAWTSIGACGSESLCVVAGYGGMAHISTNPTGGASAWQPTHVDFSNSPLQGLSCAPTSLCVGVAYKGTVVSSANPTGGETAWHLQQPALELHYEDVSCPSDEFCAAVDKTGHAIVGRKPTT